MSDMAATIEELRSAAAAINEAANLCLDFVAYTHIQISSKTQIMKQQSRYALQRTRFAVS